MSRTNASILWDFFEKDVNTKKAKCTICGDLYSYKTTTGNLKCHLRKRHIDAYQRMSSNQEQNTTPMLPCLARPPPTSSGTSANSQNSVCDVALSVPVNTPPQRNPPITEPVSAAPQQQRMDRYASARKVSATQKKVIDRDLLDLFIEGYQPFSLVEEKAFKKFASWIPGYVLPSRKTISNIMIPALYEQTKQNVHEELNFVRSSDHVKLCLTTDLWTSRANESYLAVTGHYITEQFELKSLLIQCSQFEEAHSSTNIQEKILNIVNEWGLRLKINFVVSDNAANIQKAISEIGWKHYGCYGHTLNLIVQDAIKKLAINLEKIKKIVRHFKTSTTALEKLLKAQTLENPNAIPKRLVQEVPTRWNSTYYMLDRFVELQQYVRATVAILTKNLPTISNEEWKLYEDLRKILKPFDDATKSLSGENYMTGSSVIVMTRCLITACDKLMIDNICPTAITVVNDLNNGLENRFAAIEKNRTFSICTFLDPR